MSPEACQTSTALSCPKSIQWLFLADGSCVRPASLHLEINLTLEIGQLLLSLLHAWGLDKDLDKVATTKLGLLRPKVPVSYGILSRGGAIMSLMLPTWNPGEIFYNKSVNQTYG